MRRRQLLQRAIASWAGLLLPWSSQAPAGAQRQEPAAGDAPAVTAATLGGISPAAANDYRLQLGRLEWAPGSSTRISTRAGARVYCLAAGELTVQASSGATTLWRDRGLGAGPSGQIMPLGEPVIIRAGDCLALDADTNPTMHDAWNAGGDPAIVWEAQLMSIPLSKQWQCG